MDQMFIFHLQVNFSDVTMTPGLCKRLTGFDNLRNLAQTNTGSWDTWGADAGGPEPPLAFGKRCSWKGGCRGHHGSAPCPLCCTSRDLSRLKATLWRLWVSCCLKLDAEASSWGNLLLFTEEMSTNLAGDINKYEIIHLVLTYVMNGLHLTVSIACCPNPGSSVLLLGSTGAVGTLLLKTPTFLSAKISTRQLSLSLNSLFQDFVFVAFVTKKSNWSLLKPWDIMTCPFQTSV